MYQKSNTCTISDDYNPTKGSKKKVIQSRYRPGVTQRVPEI